MSNPLYHMEQILPLWLDRGGYSAPDSSQVKPTTPAVAFRVAAVSNPNANTGRMLVLAVCYRLLQALRQWGCGDFDKL